MGVAEAIREAEALLPGIPTDEGQDPRWQAIIEVSEYIWSGPEAAVEAVWGFTLRWGVYPQEDLRTAVESAASVESSFAVSANNLLTVTSPSSVTGATGYNVYVVPLPEMPATLAA
jgi:hypothetical protein